ncbi:MAG TPA: DUF2064 domain-containing protein, partial [Solirubrobacteraceae bacterium]|nr:DUF2064 domain-containing protein [Solirubrobacteraceae bacterium]
LETSAEAWARGVAPDGVERVRAGERLEDAVARVLAAPGGPLLVLWPLLPQLRREHALAALGDLDAGSDVVLGPVIDGGLYLLGLARPLPALMSAAADRWQDPDVMTIGFAAAQEAGLEVGLLRAERALRSAEDVRAALADPLLPPEIRRVLEGTEGR